VTVNWGDGTPAQTFAQASTGTINPESHTYAAAGTYTLSETVTDTGTLMSGSATSNVSVTSLGIGVQAGQAAGIGFWHNKNGQALITSFNNGANDTTLSAWLATNFANLYGASAGANNLTGFTNAQVASFYLTLFNETGPKADAQVLAAALDVYATTSSLGGTNATQYGFTVDAFGLGASTYNVGSNGAAFGVANNTTLDVWQLLLGANAQAVNGVLYNGNTTLINDAVNVFEAIAGLGGI
jgi:PKD repeat protein